MITELSVKKKYKKFKFKITDSDVSEDSDSDSEDERPLVIKGYENPKYDLLFKEELLPE